MKTERDEAWLQQLLDDIWDRYFSDVPQHNDVRIVYGRRARNRLGSIKVDRADGDISIITINSLFKHEEVPEFVVRATIVHELCHYAHGFNSPLEQQFRHPHAGGVMRREFAERGLEELYLMQRQWLKEYWRSFIENHYPRNNNRLRTAVKTKKIPKPFWF